MLKHILAAGLIALPMAVAADSPGRSYRFVDVNYRHLDGSGGGEADGYSVAGSFIFSPYFYLLASYGDVEDFNELSGGLGARLPVTQSVDLVASANLLSVGFSNDGTSEREEGHRLTGGFRAMVTRRVEFNGSVNYTELDAFDETSYALGAVGLLSPTIGLTGNVEFFEGYNEYRAGLRFMF